MQCGKALQTWVYNKIKDDEKLKALLGERIYDAPPVNKTYPCLVIGEERSKPWQTKTTQGFEIVTSLYAFDSAENLSVVKEILWQLQAIFAGCYGTFDVFYMARCEVLKAEVMLKKKSIAQGAIQLKCVIQMPEKEGSA